MTDAAFKFDDGRAYEDFMGVWSRLVGAEFLAWLAPSRGLRWADIGCGNGCSTEQILALTAPLSVDALDPSAEQLAHARTVLAGQPVTFHQGDAMALTWDNAAFDIAQMALVIFFVPQPARGLAEMIRVTRPGGTVAAYVWDVPNGLIPWEHVSRGKARLGMPVINPPSAEISALDALAGLWRAGGLNQVEARHIAVERRFSNFDAYWRAFSLGAPALSAVPPGRMPELREAVRRELGVTEDVAFTVKATASAVKGRAP